MVDMKEFIPLPKWKSLILYQNKGVYSSTEMKEFNPLQPSKQAQLAFSYEKDEPL